MMTGGAGDVLVQRAKEHVVQQAARKRLCGKQVQMFQQTSQDGHWSEWASRARSGEEKSMEKMSLPSWAFDQCRSQTIQRILRGVQGI